MRLITTALLMIGFAGTAHAFPNYDLASNFGDVLAAEEYCGFQYNQEAIKKYIEKNVPADDMDFFGLVEIRVNAMKTRNENRTSSEKITYCTQSGRIAKHFGFLK